MRTRFLVTKLTVIAVVSAAILSFGTSRPVRAAVGFPDVPSGYWAFEEIVGLAQRGIVAGYADGTFRPNRLVTRAELAKLVVLARGIEIPPRSPGAPGPSQSFVDVPPEHWAFDYVEAAARQGLVTGYPDGTFRPSLGTNGAELLTVVLRSFGYDPQKTWASESRASGGQWYDKYQAKAIEVGLVHPDYAPRRFATRADVCYLISQSPTNPPQNPLVGVLNSNYTLENSAQGIYYNGRVNATFEQLRTHFGVAGVQLLADQDAENVSQLREFDVLVVPGATCLSMAERNALRTYVAMGGQVVALFGMGRNDSDGVPIIVRYPFTPNWDLVRNWEWGELSETYRLKFDSDPFFSTGYAVRPVSPATHPILTATLSALAQNGISGINLRTTEPAYDELTFQEAVTPALMPILIYSTKSNGAGGDDGYDGRAAAWIADYYNGRVAYFGFKLQDFYWKYADPERETARQLLINTVEWMAGTRSHGVVTKAPSPQVAAWFTYRSGRYSLWVKETVANQGDIQLRGPLSIEVTGPGNRRLLAATVSQTVPLGSSWTYDSWIVSLGSTPASGTYVVRARYGYFDFFAGGNVSVRRDYRYRFTVDPSNPYGTKLLLENSSGLIEEFR